MLTKNSVYITNKKGADVDDFEKNVFKTFQVLINGWTDSRVVSTLTDQKIDDELLEKLRSTDLYRLDLVKIDDPVQEIQDIQRLHDGH